MNRLWRKLHFLIRRDEYARDLNEEMARHLENKAQKLIDTGVAPEEARFRARREFGNVQQLEESSRELWMWKPLEELVQDLRYAFRMLRAKPGFTAVAAMSLALGIGANTAIFSLVNAALLRPLPYRDADRLVAIWEWNIRDRDINTVTPANYADWKARNRVFDDMGYSWDESYTFTGAANPEAVFGYAFSCNIFPMLGTQPLLGRTFLPEECQSAKDHVVVLSHKLWQRRFGADREIIGRAIQLNHQPCTVVGVMPAEFAHPSNWQALWTPLALAPDFFSDRKIHALRVFGRLKAGVSFERAQAEMDAIATQLAGEYPGNDSGMGVQLWPIRDFYVGDRKMSLVVLQIAVLVMLLIACVNVANLLLARASAREREVALRLALGAGTARLFRQFLTEGLLLSTLGGAAGLVLAFWGVSGLTSLFPGNLTDIVDTAHPQAWINLPVLLFTLLLSMASGVVFGAAPAFRSTASPNEMLKAGGRSFTEARGKMRLRSGLVVSQMALSLVLLIGAGLLIRSFLRLQAREYGFRTDHVLTLRLVGSSTGSGDDANMAPILTPVIERIEGLPGVEAAGAINAPPLTGMSAHRAFTIPGQAALPYGRQPVAGFHVVTPRYFRAMGIRLRRGRGFDEHDRLGAAGVAIVNETLARQFFPAQDAIGKTISVADGGTPAIREIVGVVGDTRHEQLADAPDPEIYRPFGQADWPFAGIAVRTSGDPMALAAAVRNAIWSVDKEQPIDDVTSLEQRAAASLAPRRANVILLSLFAAVALLLAAVGIYGVIAYSVSRRTQEMGIRMALGARAQQVTGLVLGRALILALGGVVIGLFVAAAATRFMGSLLVDVGAMDAATFILVPLLLCTVAVAAAYLPTRRASRVDPMVALRYE